MTKIYILTQNVNNASFILYGKAGNAVNYNFTGGNVNSGTQATLMLKNEYYQMLLEDSDLFKKGVVKLDPSYKVIEPKAEDKDLKPIEGINSVSDAVTYCAETWGEVVKNTKQAKNCAKKHGYDFVDLKEKKD